MATKKLVRVKVNGREQEAEVEPRLLLVHFIRDVLGLTGTHVGCDTTNCGACTVLLDGHAVNSCTVLPSRPTVTGFEPLKEWRRTASFTRCRKDLRKSTGSSAAFAHRG